MLLSNLRDEDLSNEFYTPEDSIFSIDEVLKTTLPGITGQFGSQLAPATACVPGGALNFFFWRVCAARVSNSRVYGAGFP